MIRGSTPTITLTMPEEIPVGSIDAATFSIAQKGVEIISKALPSMSVDATNNALVLTLSQADTLKLDKSVVGEIQVKVKIGDTVLPSEILRIPVDRILNEVAI